MSDLRSSPSGSNGIYKELAKFYKGLIPKPATTVTFFDRGEFYTIIGQDAVMVCKEILHRSSSELKSEGTDDKALEYININKVQFEVALRSLLLVYHYRIEVYDCKTWKISAKASPGNLGPFEESLFSSGDSNQSLGVAAITVSMEDNCVMVGLAHVDQAMRQFTVSEFIDNDRFSNLEAALVQLNPKECLIGGGGMTPPAVRDVLLHSGALVTERKRSEFSGKDVMQDLGRLLKKTTGVLTTNTLSEFDKKKAMACVGALSTYLEFMSDESHFDKYQLVTYDLSQYMKLDCAAVKALNLMPNPLDGRDQSIYGILNRCKTSQGQRLLRQWIRQPLMDIRKIEERLNLVEVFVSDVMLRQSVQEEHLSALPDCTKLAKKLLMSKGTLQDCYRIYQALNRLPALDVCLEDYGGEYNKLVKDIYSSGLKELLMDLSKFSALVEEVIDMDSVASMEFLIKADFDEDLAQIGQKMKELELSMEKQLTKAAAELGLDAHKTIKLESNSSLGNFLRVTRKEEKLIRNNKNYEALDTKKDGVRFTSRSLAKLNQEYLELKTSYQELQKNVVAEIMKVAAGYAEPLYRLGNLLADLDCIVSFATASTNASTPYVRPKILPTGSGCIDLKEIRHPCLEAMDVSYIPNDVTFSKDKALFHIITGPNMGGKSTYIRSVGVSVLMAQIGCFVPCSSATVTIVDSIMARVGAGDSQLKGVSTFMAEMLESSAILKAATQSSLIIIDELGRGTSTYDGFGLAWGISHYIATEIKCFTLFATHFHELTALAEEVDHVSNLHVSALTEGGHLTLLYKVVPGVCDESFGLHVARMVKFPPEVLAYAERKALELEDCGNGWKVEDNSDTDTLRKRKHDRNLSHAAIASYLKRLKTECQGQSTDQLLKTVNTVREEMSRSPNPYILRLAQCS